jgi:predicted transcriptional regulator YheO
MGMRSRRVNGKNEAIFESLRNVADILVKTFGKNCEAAIHDFSNLEHSLVYIAGSVTKRKPGAPLTDLGLRVYRQGKDGVKDIPNYRNTTNDGRTIKSSTSFVRNGDGKVIGAFCINLDITEFLNALYLAQEFVETTELAEETKAETFAVTVSETIEAIIDRAICKIGKQPSTMSSEEKIRFVDMIESDGAFLIKGAVDYVANRLGVSKYTVYRYLQKIRSDNRFLKYDDERGRAVSPLVAATMPAGTQPSSGREVTSVEVKFLERK